MGNSSGAIVGEVSMRLNSVFVSSREKAEMGSPSSVQMYV